MSWIGSFYPNSRLEDPRDWNEKRRALQELGLNLRVEVKVDVEVVDVDEID